MSKRSGLFGSRPDLLLVDERPPGINLAVVSTAALPVLEDDPEEDLLADQEQEDVEEEDSSYEAGAPLRIFIGKQPVAAEDSKVVASSTRAAMADADAGAGAAVTGPVWDASALAARADRDVDDGAGAEAARPVLLKTGFGPDGPPPLTMSFGGSFSRGSLDAGVMDEVDGVDPAEPVRTDTVVVHDQIFDRFLRFDDPGDQTGPADADGAPVLIREDLTDALSAEGMDEVDDGAPDSQIQVGPPPTRGLRVGFVAGPQLDDGFVDDDDDEDEDEDADADDSDDRRFGASVPASRGGPRYEDEDDSAMRATFGRLDPVLPTMERSAMGRSAVADGAEPSSPRLIIGQHDASPADVPRLASATPGHSATPGSSASTSRLSLPTSRLADPASGSASASASSVFGRHRAVPPEDHSTAAPRPSRLGRATPTPLTPVGPTVIGAQVSASQPQAEGGRWGLLLFAVLAVGALAVTWYLVRTPTPTRQPRQTTQVTPAVEDPQGADAIPSDGVQNLDTQPSSVAAEGAADGAAASKTPDTVTDPAQAADQARPGSEPMGLVTPAGLSDTEGVLRIRATRPSRVYIDGRYVGDTPLSALAVEGGKHSVRVVAVDTGRTRSQDVRVDVGRSQELRFSL